MVIAFSIFVVCMAVIIKTSDRQGLWDGFCQLRFPWYWTWYNIAEWTWIAVRIAILLPVVIIGHMIWEMYYLGFIAACVLTWTSVKKKLPEFTIYYGFWIWLSATILLSHIFN